MALVSHDAQRYRRFPSRCDVKSVKPAWGGFCQQGGERGEVTSVPETGTPALWSFRLMKQEVTSFYLGVTRDPIISCFAFFSMLSE